MQWLKNRHISLHMQLGLSTEFWETMANSTDRSSISESYIPFTFRKHTIVAYWQPRSFNTTGQQWVDCRGTSATNWCLLHYIQPGIMWRTSQALSRKWISLCLVAKEHSVICISDFPRFSLPASIVQKVKAPVWHPTRTWREIYRSVQE